MAALKKLVKRLFFYSSRQLYRRKRSYATIFVTSVVLLSLVMTFLEMAESYFLRDIEQAQSGTYHASIRGLLDDYTDEFAAHSNVESVYTVPYTSLMASSDDASRPARIVVETEEIDENLSVRYLWGSPPKDGEIAVSVDLYRAYGYLEAGAENDMFFTTSQMMYCPLVISGIFDCADSEAGYAFVSADTQKKIDAETGAKVKYDHYIRCKNSSKRYIAMVLKDLFETHKIPETDWQKKNPAPSGLTESGTALEIYENYINLEYLDYALVQETAPTLLISLPVIIVAALMMASFMTNWMTANASEYGILGAIGANRRQLCAISAGQILLIGLVAAVPVVILSSLVSNVYISSYNAASGVDVDFIFSVPWLKIIEAALLWNVLACFFSYIGIARLTMEYPYVLISGSFRSKMPFVKHSDYKLSRKKDRIRRLAFTRSLRQIKSGILTAVITTLICTVCGVFVYLLLLHKSSVSAVLMGIEEYSSDMLVAVSDDEMMYDRVALLSEDNMQELEAIDGIAKVGRYRYLEYERPRISQADDDGVVVTRSLGDVRGKSEDDVHYCDGIVVDEVSLELLNKGTIAGNVNDLFTKEKQVILTQTIYNQKTYSVGDKIVLSGVQQTKFSPNGGTYSFDLLTEEEFTVAAIIDPNIDSAELLNTSRSFVLTAESAVLLGMFDEAEYDRAMIWFDEGLTEEEMLAISDKVSSTPSFMRFDIFNVSMQTESEKKIDLSVTLMLCFFFGMLYLSFCTMTFVDSSLKVTKMRNEIAVLRQVGAEDKMIYKTLRCETYLVSAIALTLTVVLFSVVAYGYVSMQTRSLYMYADMYPTLYTEELIAQLKREIQMQGLFVISLLLPIIPLHLISAGVTILGTLPPTKRVLNETITEGLRKDTD